MGVTNNTMVSNNLGQGVRQVSTRAGAALGQAEPGVRVHGSNVQRLTPPKSESVFFRHLSPVSRLLLKSAALGLGRFSGWCQSHIFQRKSELDKAFTVQVKVKDEMKPLQFSGRTLAAMFGEKGVTNAKAREANLALLQKRANSGHELLRRILTDDVASWPEASPESVANLTLYLRCAAAANGEDFERGAFSIEDPSGRLYNFLDGCTKAYARKSTHLGKLTTVQIDGHTNTQRGIDLPEGKNGMPGRIRTILYGAIPEYNGQSRRIYIKPETHGCFLNKPNDIGASERFRSNRSYHFGDVKESLSHLGSLFKAKAPKKIEEFLFGKGQHVLLPVRPNALPARRESVPDRVKDLYSELTNAVEASGTANRLLEILRDGEPTESHAGIRTMLHNLETARNECPMELVPFLQQFVEPLMQEFRAIDSRHDLHARIGNEVMLNLDEIA